MKSHEPGDSAQSVAPQVLDALVAEHRRFLAFLESRVESRDVAEDILQASFGKAVEKGADIHDEDSAVAWFYRVLRNAVADHFRERAARDDAWEATARELGAESSLDEELQGQVCACFEGLIPTLKREHAEILRAVDLQQRRIVDVARELGITANHAGVRLHRARRALRTRLEQLCSTCAEHGCLNCTCESSGDRCGEG